MKLRIVTASRLHLGLLQLPSAAAAPARHFGGAGLMVRQPGMRLSAEPASTWQCAGALAPRMSALVERIRGLLPVPATPLRFTLEQAAPEHAGLGTGTQLGLALAQLIAHSCQLTLPLPELARLAGRGLRSALGAHGFAEGGFLVEAGKLRPDALSPLVARLDFPPEWRIVLILPGAESGLHGTREVEAFQQLRAAPAALLPTDRLCRLLLLGVLPALREQDFAAFSEAIHEVNRLVGEAFAPVQGGVYASPRGAEIVAWLRAQRVAGVGQSSWGPTLCAFCRDADEAAALAQRVRAQCRLTPAEVWTTCAANRGAQLLTNGEEPCDPA